MTEYYCVESCPEEGCGAENWTYNGHDQDCARVEADAIKCHACGKVFWTEWMRDNPQERELMDLNSLDDANVEDGCLYKRVDIEDDEDG